MTNIRVTFRRQDGSGKHTIKVSPEFNLSESRQAAQSLLRLPEEPCKIFLE